MVMTLIPLDTLLLTNRNDAMQILYCSLLVLDRWLPVVMAAAYGNKPSVLHSYGTSARDMWWFPKSFGSNPSIPNQTTLVLKPIAPF